jgi:hypothetical protein
MTTEKSPGGYKSIEDRSMKSVTEVLMSRP